MDAVLSTKPDFEKQTKKKNNSKHKFPRKTKILLISQKLLIRRQTFRRKDITLAGHFANEDFAHDISLADVLSSDRHLLGPYP